MSWPDKDITYTADPATTHVQRTIWNWERLANPFGVETMRSSQGACRMPGCFSLAPAAVYKITNPRIVVTNTRANAAAGYVIPIAVVTSAAASFFLLSMTKMSTSASGTRGSALATLVGCGPRAG